ncbi:MAG: radical SAM protein [Armatimonadetes bacterium]|nr:radical SAM protein [Armatimonadota bacterium]
MGLNMHMEVAGCPTVCKHCWAQGVPYGMMPLEDIRFALEGARQFCDDAGIDFGSYPMHEIAAHPQAAEVMRLFREVCGDDFEPLPTTGVPFATRDDWRELATAIGAQGTRHFWVAFHGLGAEHDALVSRDGAFQETLLAVERVKCLGFRCGANVFVTRELAAQFEPMAETLQRLGLSGMAWDVARYYPTARARQYEAHRPTLDDLRPISDRVRRLTIYGEVQWKNLEAYTEAAWVRKAMRDEWEAACQPWELIPQEGVSLVCRPNLDVHTGEAGLYGQRHGNLKADGVATTLRRAIDYGPRSKDSLYRLPDPLPSIAELAERHGDPCGQAVYFEASSMRYRWLDRAAGKAGAA